MKLNIVPARAGVQWVRAGVQIFWRQPLAFVALFFLFTLVTSVTNLVPVVGEALTLVLLPAATVGFMAATEHVQAGRYPLPTVLAAGFRRGAHNARAMLLLGVLLAACAELIGVLIGLVDGGRLAQFQASHKNLTLADLMQNADTQAAFMAAALPPFAAGALLWLPVSALFWHAPALVHWHGVPPVKSLFFSAVAVFKNTRAFLLYGAAWLLIILTINMAISLLTLATRTPAVLYALAPIWLMVMTTMLTSMWFIFRDSFTPDTPAPDTAPPPAAES